VDALGWGRRRIAKSAPVRRTPRSRERSARHGPDGHNIYSSSSRSSRRRCCTGHPA